MTIGQKAVADYMKCKEKQSGLEFQVKFLIHYQEVYIEFSCGCCVKADNSTSLSMTPEGFCAMLQVGLKKLFCGSYLKKKHAFWRNENFSKTRHFLCPLDLHLSVRLIEMIKASRHDYLNDTAVIAEKFSIKIPKWITEGLAKTDNIAAYHDYVRCVHRFYMPVYNNPSTMPDQDKQHCKERKLPNQLKKALQVVSPEISEKRLTDEQLVEIFEGSSAEQRKPKFAKKKPNKGKAPNAIRKTQKPVKI